MYIHWPHIFQCSCYRPRATGHPRAARRRMVRHLSRYPSCCNTSGNPQLVTHARQPQPREEDLQFGYQPSKSGVWTSRVRRADRPERPDDRTDGTEWIERAGRSERPRSQEAADPSRHNDRSPSEDQKPHCGRRRLTQKPRNTQLDDARRIRDMRRLC